MFRRIGVHNLSDRIQNEDIRKDLRVANIEEKIKENRLCL